jgi:hypothetical protein
MQVHRYNGSLRRQTMNPLTATACVFLLLLVPSVAFHSAARLSSRGRFGVHSQSYNSYVAPTTTSLAARKTILLERELLQVQVISPSSSYDDPSSPCRPQPSFGPLPASASSSIAALFPLALMGVAEKANALESVISKDIMNPQNFSPVCPASDGFYRLLQATVESVVGREKFIEYGPLIAGGLLRVRLELCVVESFFNEAVGPFIQANGLSWVLPLHETVETFLAGSIFALATTFILVGSTKLLTVIITYFDLLVSNCMAFA